MVAQEDFAIRISDDLLGGRKPQKAVLHAPKQAPQTIDVTRCADAVTLTVPNLDLWAILAIGD